MSSELWWLAMGNSYRSFGLQSGMDKSKCNCIIRQCLKSIRNWKSSFQVLLQYNDCKKEDKNSGIGRLLNVVGSIVVSHLEICTQNRNTANYFNHSRRCSLPIQGITDANQKFIFNQHQISRYVTLKFFSKNGGCVSFSI